MFKIIITLYAKAKMLSVLLGLETNSLWCQANLVCLAIVNQEFAVAYDEMYTAMEDGTFKLAHNIKFC